MGHCVGLTAIMIAAFGCGGPTDAGGRPSAAKAASALAARAPSGVADTPGPAPCATASPACHGELPINRRFAPYYSSYALATPNAAVTRAIIVIHGNSRDADNYFQSMVNAATAAGTLASTLIVAPHFQSNRGSCADTPAQDELVFGCATWKEGGPAVNPGPGLTVYSFDVIDRFLAAIGDLNVYPNLTSILVVGHSAGAQFAQRFAAGTAAEATLPVPVRYIVSDPSSYMYLTNERLESGATCSADGTCTGAFVPYFDAAACPGYNVFRYGLDGRTAYLSLVSDDALQTQYAARNITYLSGDRDILEFSMGTTLDQGCEANAQGIDRHSRAIIFWNYMLANRSAFHAFVNVAGCMHSASCIFSSPEARSVLFF